MKKKITVLLLFIVLYFTLAAPAFADFGPKSSTVITFTGVSDTTYYVTLLSEHDGYMQTGHVWDGTLETQVYKPGDEGYDIWSKFAYYKDEDSFFFRQHWEDCTESNKLDELLAPSPFKILVYFPESDSFCVSNICKSYAMNSYFVANLSNYESGTISVYKNYQYALEIFSLIMRIVCTIFIELVVAVKLFRYRRKELLRFIVRVNIFTQIALNLLLHIAITKVGSWLLLLIYIPLELLVFGIEAFLYSMMFEFYIDTPDEAEHPVLYSLLANAVSFAVGVGIVVIVEAVNNLEHFL